MITYEPLILISGSIELPTGAYVATLPSRVTHTTYPVWTPDTFEAGCEPGPEHDEERRR